MRDPIEQKVFDDLGEIEKKYTKLFKKNPQEANEYITNYFYDHVDLVMKGYRKLRNLLITKYTNNNHSAKNSESTLATSSHAPVTR